MSDKKNLKELCEEFQKAVKSKIGDKYKNMQHQLRGLMTLIDDKKNATTVKIAIGVIENDLRRNGEITRKIEDCAKRLRAFLDGHVEVNQTITDKKNSKPGIRSPSVSSRHVVTNIYHTTHEEVKPVSGRNLLNPSTTVRTNPLQSKDKEVKTDTSRNLLNPSTTVRTNPLQSKDKEVKTDTDIHRLETEIQYLRTAVDGLHKYVIDSDETAQKELTTPQEIQDIQSITEVEATIKEVTQRFYDIKTNAEIAEHDRQCLLLALDVLFSRIRDLSEGNAQSDILLDLDHIQSSVKKGTPVSQGVLRAKEILDMHMERIREAEYTADLLKELTECSAYADNQDTLIYLQEPPILMARASTKSKDPKKQNDEKPISRHVDQLKKSYERATNVLEKLIVLENTCRRISHLLSLSDEKHTATGRKARDNPIQTTKLSEVVKLKQDLGLIEAAWRDMKENERELENTYRRITQLLTMMNEELIATGRTQISVPTQPAMQSQALKIEQGLELIITAWREMKSDEREAEYVTCLLDELANGLESNVDKIVLNTPKTFKAKCTRKKDSMQPANEQKLMIHYYNASRVLQQMKKSREYQHPSIPDIDPKELKDLKEKYSCIYDFQWADAYDKILEADPKTKPKYIIRCLYEMLQDTYCFCGDVRLKQKQHLQDILFNPDGVVQARQRRQNEEVSKLVAKCLNDAAKLSSDVTSANIVKVFQADEKTKTKYGEKKTLCEEYLEECIKLCWLMRVQTKSLCFDFKTVEGQAFDRKCYRGYIKEGTKVAFVVWPALLHENGKLLCEGIAQGQ